MSLVVGEAPLRRILKWTGVRDGQLRLKDEIRFATLKGNFTCEVESLRVVTAQCGGTRSVTRERADTDDLLPFLLRGARASGRL
jgi:hypothetical protein